MADLTLRTVKGSPLTYGEMDENLTNLNDELADKIGLGDVSVVKPNPSASGNGDLTYNSATGEFTFTPADVASAGGIALTDLSVTTGAAAGGGSLSYDDTTGVFTFGPADVSGGGGGGTYTESTEPHTTPLTVGKYFFQDPDTNESVILSTSGVTAGAAIELSICRDNAYEMQINGNGVDVEVSAGFKDLGVVKTYAETTKTYDAVLEDPSVTLPVLVRGVHNNHVYFGDGVIGDSTIRKYSISSTDFSTVAPVEDQVVSITIGAGGSGYTTAPAVSFSGGGGTGAAATAEISGGAVVGITITNRGTGYTSAPTISLAGGGGTGAAATATIGQPEYEFPYPANKIWYVNGQVFVLSETTGPLYRIHRYTVTNGDLTLLTDASDFIDVTASISSVLTPVGLRYTGGKYYLITVSDTLYVNHHEVDIGPLAITEINKYPIWSVLPSAFYGYDAAVVAGVPYRATMDSEGAVYFYELGNNIVYRLVAPMPANYIFDRVISVSGSFTIDGDDLFEVFLRSDEDNFSIMTQNSGVDSVFTEVTLVPDADKASVYSRAVNIKAVWSGSSWQLIP